jgi:hypothetical protein
VHEHQSTKPLPEPVDFVPAIKLISGPPALRYIDLPNHEQHGGLPWSSRAFFE